MLRVLKLTALAKYAAPQRNKSNKDFIPVKCTLASTKYATL